jgi:hypothetical protein
MAYIICICVGAGCEESDALTAVMATVGGGEAAAETPCCRSMDGDAGGAVKLARQNAEHPRLLQARGLCRPAGGGARRRAQKGIGTRSAHCAVQEMLRVK